MPELAEVEYFRKQWDPGLGERVHKVRARAQARIFRESAAQSVIQLLNGREMRSSHAHGKQLAFRFSEETWLGIHLGMSGRLYTGAPEMVPGKHEHLVLVMDSVALVYSDYRKFGKVLAARGTARDATGRKVPPWWEGLPPQPQEGAFDKARFREILRQHPGRRLKALLLDQDAFPGIGNWMADEILWQARIHPADRPGDLSSHKRNKLFEATKDVSREALRYIGKDWTDPPESWLFRHRWKKGGTCPASGKPLVHETIGGRTTCFCPAVQKPKH